MTQSQVERIDGLIARRDVRLRSGVRARRLAAALVWIVLAANAAAVVWLWARGGNLHAAHSGDVLTSLARITGLLGAYSALLQVLLLARLPWLERATGFDRLSAWHRYNGHVCLYLVLAHVVCSVYGYALLDTMLGGGVYPGMITATVATALLLVVVASSIVVVRRRLRYEWWYAVHLAAYASIALGWFHQIPTGNELVLDDVAADYWRSLYVSTLAALVVWRVLVPLANVLRFQLRVGEVVTEAPGIVSLRLTGRHLDRLRASPGQFFLWRFLDRRRWWSAHPFSLSAAPDGRSLRITVKALGDHSARLAEVAPGTRVLAEGPFGVFTSAMRRREKVLLIAGGIGITPVRALLEDMHGDVVVLYRVLAAGDVVFEDELDALGDRARVRVEYVVGDHATAEGRALLSPTHLRELVPDLAERDVYLCGPPAMTAAVEASLRRSGLGRGQVHVERFAL